MDYDVIVVGAGISGLLSALTLSKEGKKVLVLERSSFIGGNARSYEVNGYKVDTGPHAITGVPVGPLARLFKKYTDGLPELLPHGHYYFRTCKRLYKIPASIKDWARFDAITHIDKIVISKLILAEMIRESITIEKSERSVYDCVKDCKLSENTFKLIDTLCYFMSGKSMKETPAKRMFSGFGLEGMEKMNVIDSLYGLKRFFISHKIGSKQWYPVGGLGKMIETVIEAFPEDMVDVRMNSGVDKILIEDGKAVGVECDGTIYKSKVVVYTGFVNGLEKVVSEKLPSSFSDNIKKIKQAKSYTLWLGLKEKLAEMDYIGSEVWYESGEPYWAMPVSNYDASLAPVGRQLIAFTFVVKDSIEKTKKDAWDTIVSVFPDIEALVEMRHEQVTIPEKAAITVDSFFCGPCSPFSGLYLAGTDTDPRSMGLTRAAHSVEEILAVMKKNGFI
ncbi:MAG: NAD(P)/FAD-dependent oxidoreductase [Candidatus Aenigmarchaeota archaeon]|nr:NAD(P)/FAD-dependent oxidoreductase [Candidatus Aenigmarchaeota archaeon]MCK5062967.1 NAD(P)/FAD-dependent oxidoreductase [Candidatus Aenigmarchaeota archaeon]